MTEKVMCNLLVLRSLAGYTQTEISKKSGVAVRQIQRIENGESKLDNVTLGTMKKLANALNYELADFKEISPKEIE